MADVPESSSVLAYIVTGLLTALGTVVTTIVAIAKRLENMYIADITSLKAKVSELEKHNSECHEQHFQLALRVAELEATRKV
jgi:hypothetical protein